MDSDNSEYIHWEPSVKLFVKQIYVTLLLSNWRQDDEWPTGTRSVKIRDPESKENTFYVTIYYHSYFTFMDIPWYMYLHLRELTIRSIYDSWMI